MKRMSGSVPGVPSLAAFVMPTLALLVIAPAARAQYGYMGEIRLISFNYPHKGWAFCAGQVLAINQNQALYSLLGTRFGGNGQTNFQLPDLRDRVGIGYGQGPGLENYALAQKGGEDLHALTVAEMPAHAHLFLGDSAVGTSGSPVGLLPARNAAAVAQYKAGAATAMAVNATGSAGSSAPHENRPPYLGLNYIIALQGTFPSAGPDGPPTSKPDAVQDIDPPFVG